MKARCVIPAAGLGTRMRPITRVIPKELLPVGTRPIVQWCLTEALEGGLPSRKAGQYVELLEKPADDLIAVLLAAQRVEAPHHLGEGGLDFGKRTGGVAIALRFQTAAVIQKLFAIKIGEAPGGLSVCPRRPLVRQRSGH